jgi:dienelactone hydrolase
MRITPSLLAASLLLAATASPAQQPVKLPAVADSAPTPQTQSAPPPNNSWTAPPGTTITIDRRSGRYTMTLPVQPVDGSAEQALRFTDWDAHPYAGSGPYPATRQEPASLPTHTLYLPADLAHAPKLPIVLWANGGCRNTSVEFTRFLGEIASHGYLIVAVGRSTIPFLVIHGSIAAVASQKDANGDLYVMMDASYMTKGLDWAIAENSRPASPLFGKLDTTKVATMGQSCGGPQAFTAAHDPRVTTVIALNSNFPTAGGAAGAPARPNPNANGWTADKLTIPAALFNGGPADSGYTGAETTYKALPLNPPRAQGQPHLGRPHRRLPHARAALHQRRPRLARLAAQRRHPRHRHLLRPQLLPLPRPRLVGRLPKPPVGFGCPILDTVSSWQGGVSGDRPTALPPLTKDALIQTEAQE